MLTKHRWLEPVPRNWLNIGPKLQVFVVHHREGGLSHGETRMSFWERCKKRPIPESLQGKLPLEVIQKTTKVRVLQQNQPLKRPRVSWQSSRWFSGNSRKPKPSKQKKDLRGKTNRKSFDDKKHRFGLDGRLMNGDMKLRSLKVSQKTLNRYLACIQQFEHWATTRKINFSGARLDKAVNKYLHFLFDDDAELNEATYLVYGLQLLKCTVPKHDFLTVSKQSLSGWRKQQPGSMRVPVPEEFVFDLGQFALDNNRVDIAMMLAIQYDAYLRPSEALSLTKKHVGFPQGKRYPHWSLVIAPSTLRQTTKTGKSDDSILLADLPHNSWMKECMKLFLARVGDQLFDSLTLGQLESWCKQACNTLGYSSACVMPHIVRHAGASNDMYHKRRALAEIQKRRRWSSKSSVSRYEKHALLLKQWEQVAPCALSQSSGERTIPSFSVAVAQNLASWQVNLDTSMGMGLQCFMPFQSSNSSFDLLEENLTGLKLDIPSFDGSFSSGSHAAVRAFRH